MRNTVSLVVAVGLLIGGGWRLAATTSTASSTPPQLVAEVSANAMRSQSAAARLSADGIPSAAARLLVVSDLVSSPAVETGDLPAAMVSVLEAHGTILYVPEESP